MANTVSLLIRQQLPEFIRDDYDTFVEFVEAYYEWMDQTGNTMDVIKHMPQYLDLDTTLDTFVEYFVQQFLPLFPPDQLINPTFFIQHAKELYRTKGTTKSVKLLFRLLYNQDIEIFYPKDSILRASTSTWTRPYSMRLDPTIWTQALGDGTTTRFRALDHSRGAPLSVYLNGVLQGSGYSHSPNNPWVTFTAAPGANVEVKFTYAGIDLTDLFNTRHIITRFVGQTTGATGVSESLQRLTEDDAIQLDLIVSKTTGTFSQSEIVKGRWVYDLVTQDYVDIYGRLVSYVSYIQIVDGGLGYNVGDPVIVTGGFPATTATAVVDSIFSALISNIAVIRGGAGYQPGQSMFISSSPNTGLNTFILSVDNSGNVHPNSYPINQDVMNLWSHLVMSDPDFYFTPGVSENVDTIMSIAFTDTIYGKHPIEQLGPVTSVVITSSTFVFSPPPTLNVTPLIIVATGLTANGTNASANVPIDYFGIMGRMNVAHGGSNYQVGDELGFQNIPGVGIGIGCAGEVTSLHTANSGIKTVHFRPSRIDGTVTVNTAQSNTQVVGIGTFFTTQLNVASHIEINSESSYVASIANDTHLTVNTAFTRNSTNRRCGIYGKYFIGGMNYRQEALPTIMVTSGSGTAAGANIRAEQVIQGGAQFLLTAQTEEPPGKIRAIRVTNHGYGYLTTPTVDLTGSGNGRANAVAIMLSNLFNAPGRFQTTEGFLSSEQKLQDAGYYTTYAYVVKSETELSRYKNVLKNLLHPAGMNLWGEYVIEDVIGSANGLSANIADTFQGWIFDTIIVPLAGTSRVVERLTGATITLL